MAVVFLEESMITCRFYFGYVSHCCCPVGSYLLRIEQFWRNLDKDWEQWFINCAQVNIVGSGGGSLEGYPFAKFPGSYDKNDPGNLNRTEFFSRWPVGYSNLLNWVAPGPPVWTGS
ncbi:hypothetical protein CC80DRAFT_279525 [Byssothecium circinans]|uniref:AA9 family lytic polysaccharide monooxygenase n=1 Tax=Byssothecium circinans TaxID=147558 RepID=A0A6A5TAE8_9PLEO|nr:hypothetical protein CC80DRAFT_279525 [Byssothecium circinans]